MYCHQCGNKTDESVCPNCGTKILTPESKILESWRKERDYHKIARHPEVLDLIVSYSRSKSKLSGNDVLNKVDLVFGTLTGISMKLLEEVAVPLYEKLGVKTSKSNSIVLQQSIQEAFFRTICSMVKNGYSLDKFYEAKDGVILVAKIKSDLLTWGGNVLVELKENDGEVYVKINTLIRGQFYDWGKGKRILKKINSDLLTIYLG